MKPKVLIIEDSITIFETIQAYIEHLYKIDHVISGKEAFLILSKEVTPDVILLDLNLPDIHGLKLMSKIKEKNIPFIIMTGEKSKEIIIKAIQGGAVDYLTKPIDPKRLKTSLEKALKKKKNSGGNDNEFHVSF